MRSVRTFRLEWFGVVALGAVLLTGCQAAASGSDTHTAEQVQALEFPRIGLRFAVPAGFLVGRFATDPTPPTAVEGEAPSPWENAVVLVEPAQLGRYEIEGVPIGDIPAIWVDRPAMETSVLGRFNEADSTFTVPAGEVYRYPGFPGPYGDQAFYFVVELGEGDYAEVMAHRFLFRTTDMEPSHYDEAILSILGSLEVLP